MKKNGNLTANHSRKPAVRRTRREQGGQILPFVAVSLFALLGFFGLTIDVGRLYIGYNQLQASTNAAALAGGEALAQLSGPSAATVATTFSSSAGGDNAHLNLPVSMATGYPKLYCSSTLSSTYNILCVPPLNSANGTTSVNAIIVMQQVNVPTLFLSLVGKHTVSLTATATASMKGVSTGPFNVAIIVDTTGSMGSTDRDSQCNTTRLSCALAGVQVLLNDLAPCAANLTSCGTATANSSGGGANVATAVDRVSLFAFPPVVTSTVSKDYTCGRGAITTGPYYTVTPPVLTGLNPPLQLETYQIVNYSSDYRTSDTATTLNTNSNIVAAVGATSRNGGAVGNCLQAPGGADTYYAQVVQQAQASLVAEHTLFPNTQNVMILLSDGDATADAASQDFWPNNCSGAGVTPCTTPYTGSLATFYSSTTKQGTGINMSVFYQCQQAITAAQAATAAGTKVYTVAYGAESSGCASDNTACIASGRTTNCVPSGISTVSAVTPCYTMQNMASNAATFFSDYTATGSSGSCISAARPTTSLNQIFTQIATDLTVSRLIPNGTP